MIHENYEENKSMLEVLVYAITDHLGGIENFFINYNDFFSENIRLDYISISDNITYWDKLNKNENKLYYLPMRKDGIIERKKILKNILQQKKYDILWFNANDLCDIEVLKIAKKNKVKNIICHAHNSKADRLYRRYSHKFNMNKIEKYVNYKFACSTQAANWFYGKQSINAKQIYNSVNINRFRYNLDVRKLKRKELNIDDNTLVIGNVGRLCKQKNQKWLIKLFEKYHKFNSNSVLVILGEGELHKELDNIIKESGLEDAVLMMGQVNDVNNYLMAFDLIWMPSLYEGLPVTLVEAQAAGLPCVVSDIITREVEVTDLIKYISTDDTKIDQWIESVYINMKRENGFEELSDSEFNIKKSAYMLEAYLQKEAGK